MPKRNIAANLVTITKRKLPHWQQGGVWYFVTFRTKGFVLPEEGRSIVKSAVLEGAGIKYDISIGVVMPDHVHLLIKPFEKADGIYYSLSGILKTIKGKTSHQVNTLLIRSGSCWQKESYDRIMRDEVELREKHEYIRGNAVRAGLVGRLEEYPWLIIDENVRP